MEADNLLQHQLQSLERYPELLLAAKKRLLKPFDETISTAFKEPDSRDREHPFDRTLPQHRPRPLPRLRGKDDKGLRSLPLASVVWWLPGSSQTSDTKNTGSAPSLDDPPKRVGLHAHHPTVLSEEL